MMPVTVVVMVVDSRPPDSVTAIFLTCCWPSSQTWKLADVTRAEASACPVARVLAEIGSLASAEATEKLPVYSVTGTPPIVAEPALCTLVASAWAAASWMALVAESSRAGWVAAVVEVDDAHPAAASSAHVSRDAGSRDPGR